MDLTDLPVITFEQSWQGVEWAARQNFNKKTLAAQVTNIRTPDDNVYRALESMHQAFYPQEATKTIDDALDYLRSWNGKPESLRIDGYLPWVMHKALDQMRRLRRLKDKQFDDVITDILQREWLLTWHWRAVLPSLRDWDENNKNKRLIVQISHVRKWEMLLCYTVSINDLRTYERPSEIPLKNKDLVRPPLFGISHRLKGWDTYRLFYQPHIKEYIDRRFQESTNRAYVLGRHDCFYIVDELALNGRKYQWKLRPFMDAEPEKAVIDRGVLGASCTYDKACDLIDIPSFTAEHKGIPQLLSSDNYCEAILELTEVLNDPTAKSVLLIAPPGSGKEKLAESAFYCRDQLKPSGNFVATTLAGLNAVEAAKLLFSFPEGDKLDDNYDPRVCPKNGLIFKAMGGALFIDEIDKTHRSIRDLLLRVLESGQITVPNSSLILEIPKHRIPLYIFAGSKNRKAMYEEGPVDFWTRISHVIEVAHPLGIDDLEKSRRVAKDYLWMFWCLHVKDFMQRRGVKNPNDVKETVKPLNDFYISLYKFLMDRITVDFVTDILANEISGRGKPLVSIRTLRSIVARSVFKFVEVLLYSKFDDDPIEIYKETSKSEFQPGNADPWFDRLREIVRNESRGKRDRTASQVNRIELSVVESFRTAIRMGTSLAQ